MLADKTKKISSTWIKLCDYTENFSGWNQEVKSNKMKGLPSL